MILTGGRATLTTVSLYSESGWVRDLPGLKQGRYGHGCSSYNNAEGTKVDIDIKYCSTILIFQTYLVSGGYDGSDVLSSTELLVESSSAWVYTLHSLPSPRAGLRGANIDNKVLMTGNL